MNIVLMTMVKNDSKGGNHDKFWSTFGASAIFGKTAAMVFDDENDDVGGPAVAVVVGAVL